MRFARVSLLPACVLAVVGALSGCGKAGPATAEVAGSITFERAPVPEGTVTFHNPKLGVTAEAQLQGDGTFTVKAVPVGRYVVTVTPLKVMYSPDIKKVPEVPTEKQAGNIPKGYRRPSSSPLLAEVKEGKNEFSFNMQGPPRR
jgi:hypothetical protein